MVKLQLYSENLVLHAATDRNRFPFVGDITFGGRVSDGFVGGTEAIPGGPFRVLIPSRVLKAKITGLEGKKVFAAESLDTHTRGIAVGEFLHTWIEPVESDDDGEFITVAKASGILEASADEELVEEIVSMARRGVMGFSWDLKEVRFDLQEVSGETVVVVADFQWRGATILKKEAAAYRLTQLAAQKSKPSSEEDIMTKEEKETQQRELANLVGEAVKQSLEEFRTSVIKPIEDKLAVMDEVKETMSQLQTKQTELETAVVEAKQKTDDQSSKKKEEEKEKEVKKVDNAVPLDKLATSIATAVSEALKKDIGDPLKKLGERMEAEEREASPRIRRSYGHDVTELVAKYAGDEFDEEEGLTIDGINAAIAVVKETVKDRNKRIELLNVLSPVKRHLQRTSRRQGGYIQ